MTRWQTPRFSQRHFLPYHFVDFLEHGEDEGVDVDEVEGHDAAELHAQRLARVVALQDAEHLEQHGEEEVDDVHHHRGLVAAPQRALRVLLGGARHHEHDGVRGGGEHADHQQVDRHPHRHDAPAATPETERQTMNKSSRHHRWKIAREI